MSRRTRYPERAIIELERKRAEAGHCRHCDGPLPCWSEYGDHAPGKRHTPSTFARARAYLNPPVDGAR